MSKPFSGKVKFALSGDSFVVSGINNPSLERTFSLAYVTAPRLSKDGDERFAFQSREFLREIAVSKQVNCTILYTIPNSQREYGTATLLDGTDLAVAAVKAGWLKVREDAGKKEDNEEILERIGKLQELEAGAKSQGIGLWAEGGGDIEVQNDLGGQEFVKEWKGKTVDGIIERVLSGDRLLVRLLLSEKKHAQVMTLLAGVRTPSTARSVAGQTHPAEEYGDEAKSFVEARLLQKKIKVHIIGTSPQGQLVAQIIHPRGNISHFLLEEGLARCNDHHSTMLGSDMAKYRAAEKKAQGDKKRLHKQHVAKTSGKESEVTVAKIISSDTIIIRGKDGNEKRIGISSVRGPRTTDQSESPFRDDAREFLRKKLIGKHVKVTVDGSKPATEGFEARDVATVTQNGKNVGLVVVQEGWASVIRHRKDDTDRAPNYDELLAAQEAAKEDKKGMWSGKASKAKTLVDASESAQKAKLNLGSLQRQRKIPAVVDFCKSGSRFTILVPREGIKLTLVLGGIKAPRAPGRGAEDKGEPFGAEALDLANKRCNQRDVEVDIFDVDKVGGFIGSLYVGHESFAKVLVEEGYAEVFQSSAERSGNAAELTAAEKKAKEARKGRWHDYDPSQDQEEEYDAPAANGTNGAAEEVSARPKDYRDIIVTNIDSNGRLKLQEVGNGTARLESLMSEFKKFHLSNPGGLKNDPKAGDLVAAKFSLDGEWYRAKIRSNDRAAKVAEVVFIDYGNSEKIPWKELRPLDQANFNTQRLKPQAIDAALSFVQFSNSPDYLREAINYIAEITEGRRLVGSFDFVDNKEGLNYITIFDPSSKGSSGSGPGNDDSVNRQVILEGYGMVPQKLKPWERAKGHEAALAKLKEAEREAKDGHRCIWEYGDLTED